MINRGIVLFTMLVHVEEIYGGSVVHGDVLLLSSHKCMLIFPLSSQFLGNTEVEAPKGTEVVKDAVRKLKVSL